MNKHKYKHNNILFKEENKMHWTQREKLKNLDKIRSWINGVDPEKIDIQALERRSTLTLGCTRQKAKEYIKEILGE
jgi:hypothetical protein